MEVSIDKIKDGPLKAHVQRVRAQASDARVETKDAHDATMNVEKNAADAIYNLSENASGAGKAFEGAAVGEVQDLPQQLANLVRAHPVVSFWAAVAVGFLVMRITRSQST